MPEAQAFEDQIYWKNGFYPNVPSAGASVDGLDIVWEGKNVVFNGLGQPQSWRGIQSVGSAAPTMLQLVGDALGGLATGSAVLYQGKSIWYVGTGSVFYSDLSSSIDTATSTLKFKFGSTVYNAGLSAPSVPSIAVDLDGSGVPTSGTISGTVSARITRYRSVTGTESGCSDVTDVITPNAGKLKLTFPACNTADGQDQWGIYLSRQTFGSQGPHFLWDYINETDLNGSREYTLDFLDADLYTTLAPRNIITAPAATHVVALGDLMLLVGTQGGVAVLPSLPGQPEQFDLSYTWFLQPTEPVVRVDTRPADGVVYIWTKNSLQTVVETGDSTAPVITRSIWPNTGIIGQSSACLTESGAYAFSSRQGMVRTSGYADPDTNFALPVQNRTAHWNPADVVVGYDPSSNMVVYCYQKTILAYNQANNLWSSELAIDDFLSTNNATTRIVGAATYNGELYLSIGDGTTNKLYKYNSGVGTDWYARTANRSAGAYGWYKWLRSCRLQGNFTNRVEPTVYINSNDILRVVDGYQCTGIDGILTVEQIFPANSMASNEPYVEFTIPSSTSTGKVRVILFPSTSTATNIAATIGTTGAFYVDIAAGGAVDGNGQVSLGSGTVAAGYKVRIQRKQTGNKWAIFVYDTAGVQVATTSFNPGTDITTGSVGVKMTLYAPVTLTKQIKNLYISGGSDTTTYLKLYKKYGTIAEYSQGYSQSDPTVYPWQKINVKDAVVYQVEISGRGAEQKPFLVEVTGIVRPIMR